MVPVETRLSSVLTVSFARFLIIMVGLHLLVATVEAFVTFAVVSYLIRVRPAVLESSGVHFSRQPAGSAPGALRLRF